MRWGDQHGASLVEMRLEGAELRLGPTRELEPRQLLVIVCVSVQHGSGDLEESAGAKPRGVDETSSGSPCTPPKDIHTTGSVRPSREG